MRDAGATVVVGAGQAGIGVASCVAEAAALPGDAVVAVDSEPKVASAVGAVARGWAVHTDALGRANNFAMGYNHDARRGGSLCAAAVDSVRRAAERRDRFAGVLVCAAASGGTGSGLGARLLESLSDAAADATIVSVPITSAFAADTPLKPLNTALALAASLEAADAVLCLDNGRPLAAGRSMRDVNREFGAAAAAHCCAAALPRHSDARTPIRRFLEDVLPVPGCPIASACAVVGAGDGRGAEAGLAREARETRRIVRERAPDLVPHRGTHGVLLGAQLVRSASLRGPGVEPHIAASAAAAAYGTGRPVVGGHARAVTVGDCPWGSVASLATCAREATWPVATSAARARRLVRAGAYVHWFEAWGVDGQDIALACDVCTAACDAITPFEHMV